MGAPIVDFDAPSKVVIDVILVLDRSISMEPSWKETLSGLNEYIQTLRLQENADTEIKVTMFNFYGNVELMYNRVSLDTLPTFTEDHIKADQYGTALYDAIGEALLLPEVANPALVVIITDGEENSSKRHYPYDVRKMIEAKKALGNYTFVYLGADEAAWSAAKTFAAPGNISKGTPATRSADFHSFASNMGTYTSNMVENTRAFNSGTMLRSAMSTESFYGGTISAADSPIGGIPTTTIEANTAFTATVDSLISQLEASGIGKSKKGK